MKTRRNEALLMIFLIATSTFTDARQIPSKHNEKLERTKRQGDDALGTMMQLGLKFAPLIINSMLGGGGGGGGGLADLAASFLGGGGSPAAAKPAVNTKLQSTSDKTDKIGATDTADIFSWSNLLSMGVKIALSLFSSYTSGGLDRNGQEISPMQTVMGTVISALTGSEDPSEVSTMAKQATEVLGLIGTLVEALRTSFTS